MPLNSNKSRGRTKYIITAVDCNHKCLRDTLQVQTQRTILWILGSKWVHIITLGKNLLFCNRFPSSHYVICPAQFPTFWIWLIAFSCWWLINFLYLHCLVFGNAKLERWTLVLSAWPICDKFTVNLSNMVLASVGNGCLRPFYLIHSHSTICWNSSIKIIFTLSTIFSPLFVFLIIN